MISNKYGYFDNNKREFVITDPRTPRPWFNYMWNRQYAGLISHTGGGFSYYQSARDNRITRMRYNSLPWDRPGRYIYCRDRETGEYWSLSWAPTIEKEYDLYECHHGMGYTTIITERRDIRAELSYFVPVDAAGEIWRVRLINKGKKDRQFDIFAFTELLMGNALNDLINQPNDKHFTDIGFNKEYQSLVATRRYWVLNKGASVKQSNIGWEYNVLFAATCPVTGFDTSLDAFIGKWRSEANPQTVEAGRTKQTEITAGDPCATLSFEQKIPAGEQKDFAVCMMLSEKAEGKDPFRVIDGTDLKDYQNMNRIHREFQRVRDEWDKRFSVLDIKTPDESFNTMLGVWNYYQTHVTFDMARNAGYYHGGLLFGTGIRDQFQDIFGVLISDPERVRERLLQTLRYQFRDGSTLHNYFKLVKTGERTYHSDTPLWIPLGIAEYIKETGDTDILTETVEFYDEGRAAVSVHVTRALDYALSQTGENGLPKIMSGDWNDTLDYIGPEGKGETVWGAFFLAYVIRLTADCLDHTGRTEEATRFRQKYEILKKTINDIAWDGDRYVRAFRDNGTPVGKANDEQGQLFLNAQTWAVISGVADKKRADIILATCLKYLETPCGMKICHDAFHKVDDSVGLISRCVPGKKENGAVFNHASAWFVLATLENNNTEDAFRIYRKMMPPVSSETARIDRYETEPYVYSEYVTSPDHKTEGQASHSWLTGSAVWMFRIGLSHILGIRPEFDGLHIDPKIPQEWKKLTVKRRYRGKMCHITIENPNGVYSGVKSVEVNGKSQNSCKIKTDAYPENKLQILVRLK